MAYQHYFEPKALQEYIKAFKWYKKRSHVSAANFVKEMDTTINLICSQPDRFHTTYKHFRETALKRYPFYIIYTIEESKKHVVIFSVFHFKRNPLKKYKRK